MTKIHSRSENIRKFILHHLDKHPTDINKLVSKEFGITRQAANKHLQKLTAEKILTESGQTRSRTYKLAPLLNWKKQYNISTALQEDIVWSHDIKPELGQMADNVLQIWQHAFTEMFNNAIDHSAGQFIFVEITKTAVNTEMVIYDDGIGIFKKIQTALSLLDERQAILELSKGKLTTDPQRHSGEGIFFTSRMFNGYDILSGGVYFSHQLDRSEDWIMERSHAASGTFVWMKLDNHTSRTTKKVFDKYTSGQEYSFNKTIVPVELAQYGNDMLISRSQAKRVLARVELFKTVIFDFTNITSIGQAFADEIFRVFALQHPEITLQWINCNQEVQQMITRARINLSV